MKASEAIETLIGIRRVSGYSKSREEALDMAIAAVDAVPVVRCGECKHREEKTFWCEKVQDFISNPEWFCADGERKGDVNDAK